MTPQDQSTFDPRIADWLEDDPNTAPDQALEIVLAAFPSIKQRHASRVPRRFTMPTLPKLAIGAAAVVVVVLTGAFLLRPPAPGTGGGPTPSPSTAPASALPSPSTSAWTTYASSRFAYTIAYPADWVAIPATQDWPPTGFPDKQGTDHDVLGPKSYGTRLFVSSVPLTAGKTVADWLAALDSDNTSHLCHLSTPRTITVDGVNARMQEGPCMFTDQLIEVVMANDKRFYQINLFNGPVGGYTDADRATLDRALASFRFGG